jgi:hypothetical protein
MPTDAVSFWLKPFGFFDRNPTLDVPPAHLARLRLAWLAAFAWLVRGGPVVLLELGQVFGDRLPHLIEPWVVVAAKQAGRLLAGCAAGPEPGIETHGPTPSPWFASSIVVDSYYPVAGC